MKAKTTEFCPEAIKKQLLEWQKKGWLTIEYSNDELLPPIKSSEERTPHEEKKELSIEEQWCNKLKEIAKTISSKLNNKLIEINPRGYSSSYKFFFDSEGFCKMMDELCKNHRNDITQYLHKTKKPTGVTFVFPFLGEILNALIFNKKEIQKADMEDVFSYLGYKGSVAIKKLSMHGIISRNPDANLLVEKAKMIARRSVTAE